MFISPSLSASWQVCGFVCSKSLLRVQASASAGRENQIPRPAVTACSSSPPGTPLGRFLGLECQVSRLTSLRFQCRELRGEVGNGYANLSYVSSNIGAYFTMTKCWYVLVLMKCRTK